MYILHGFYQYTSLIDNTRDQVNLLGELSDDSLTYAKDKAYLTHGNYPQTILVGFHSVKDNNYLEVPTALGVRCLQIGQWLLNRAQAGQIGTNPDTLRSQLQSEFGANASDFRLGQLIADGGIRLPEWIEYVDALHGVPNQIKIWLSDPSFKNQYPNYYIEVIPPFTPIDDLFLPPAQVKARLESVSVTTRLNQIQALRGDYPYTLVAGQEYNFINPVNPSEQYSTTWTVLIYGQAGNNPDLIREAIVRWILENSNYDRSAWEEIIPDLFLNTEYLITPFWTQYSTPNLELQAGLYSPVVRPHEALTLLKQSTQGPKYTDQWIEQAHEYSGVQYKSLAFGVVGSPDNRDGVTSFVKRFPDYILVTNNSSDFNRMSVRTQNFVIMLGELIKTAEKMTTTTAVPVGMSRLQRNGVVYIGKHYENILYMVATKQAVEKLMEDQDD